jgi:hypothetical protein
MGVFIYTPFSNADNADQIEMSWPCNYNGVDTTCKVFYDPDNVPWLDLHNEPDFTPEIVFYLPWLHNPTLLGQQNHNKIWNIVKSFGTTEVQAQIDLPPLPPLDGVIDRPTETCDTINYYTACVHSQNNVEVCDTGVDPECQGAVYSAQCFNPPDSAINENLYDTCGNTSRPLSQTGINCDYTVKKVSEHTCRVQYIDDNGDLKTGDAYVYHTLDSLQNFNSVVLSCVEKSVPGYGSPCADDDGDTDPTDRQDLEDADTPFDFSPGGFGGGPPTSQPIPADGECIGDQCDPEDIDGGLDGGEDGADGTDGSDGSDGTDGTDGSDGTDGGTDGTGGGGADGGTDGTDGADGSDGTDGTDGGTDGGTGGGSGGGSDGGTDGTDSGGGTDSDGSGDSGDPDGGDELCTDPDNCDPFLGNGFDSDELDGTAFTSSDIHRDDIFATITSRIGTTGIPDFALDVSDSACMVSVPLSFGSASSDFELSVCSYGTALQTVGNILYLIMVFIFIIWILTGRFAGENEG